MEHGLVLVPSPTRRTDTRVAVVLHTPMGIARQVMTQAEANKWVTMMSKLRQGHLAADTRPPLIEIQSIEQCATCGTDIEEARPRLDHNGNQYCSEICWEEAWR